jgi:hypothetical protein
LRGREVSQSVVVAYLIKHRGMDLDAAIPVWGASATFFYEHHFMGVLSDFYRSVKA